MKKVLALLVAFFGMVSVAQAQDAAAGKIKFETYCVTCHGPSGKGDGPAAVALTPKPRDLSVTKRTDDEIKKILKEGGTAVGMTAVMPAWGAVLNDADIGNVISYVRQLGKAAGAAPAPAAAPAAAPATPPAK